MPDGASPPLSEKRLIEAVAARYAGASRFTRGYVGSKLRRDPSTAALLALAQREGGLGQVADLGCGRGQLALALLLSGAASGVVGLDYEEAKVAEARAAGAGLAARFIRADLTAARVPDCDTALMVDVLYQLPEAAQAPLLDRVAAAARRRVVLRLFDPGRGWRSTLGMAMERAGRAIRRDGAAVRPMPVAEVSARLAGAGFTSEVTPCWAGTPLPNVLLVAERAA
ncbi:methyltransferase domain-containing protein [Roseomonas nepalensis]|uniref:Methyltransferase domain-containing protein n=1 Tax=Muricoccus nepalensis TaxID=1854500 RepID=A0A502FVT1_9PROT|nr:methyltransferase domain-containing protein [Roseomonas nepalensis]TPG53519.1 methyltransferase domain-containing protein [Roseomonas nepalensis]